MVNVVLSAKAEELERAGLRPEFAVSLPERLFVSDVDLCALLGNALDNAREGAQGCAGAKVRLRCRLDKGLLMLRVENPVAGPVPDDLTTTKPDRDAHGFGIPGMREIARRYGGTLEAGAEQGKFQLLVCLPDLRNRQKLKSTTGPKDGIIIKRARLGPKRRKGTVYEV